MSSSCSKPTAKSKKPTAKNKKPTAKSKKPTAKNKKPTAKSKKPTGKSKKAVQASVEAKRRASVDSVLMRRQEDIRDEVSKMEPEELRLALCRAIEVDPGLMFSVLRPAQPQPGGYHPGPGNSPDWCVCGHCREMPTQAEKICCERETCMSQLADFDILMLDEGVLNLAKLYRRDVFVFEDEPDAVKANRHQAYRQYVLWTYGRLGVGDRRVIPSCCVWRIRDKFPDPFGQYAGFVPARIG